LVKAYAADPSNIAEVYRFLHKRGLGTGMPPTASPFKDYEPSLFVIALEWLEGIGGKTLLEHSGGHLAGKLAAQWLLASRDLDFVGAPDFGPTTILSWGRKWAGLLGSQQSEIARRMRGICDQLEARPPHPEPESLRHGSYSVSHVLDLGGGPGVVDWDSFRKGRLELDAGHYLAYLSRFASGRTRLANVCRGTAASFKSSLEGAVDESDLAWFKAAALIRLTWYLCQRKPSRWTERATGLLDEAKRDLTLD
jgi:aminoglycoside phosphotransferase (APT) family kinase protein